MEKNSRQSTLLAQYGQVAEQIRHQDSLAWQTFSYTFSINGIGIAALASIGIESLSNPISLLVVIIGLTSCLFGGIHVFRAIRYQEHAYGIAKEIELRLPRSVKLFSFNPNDPDSYSQYSKFYQKKISSIAKISARKVWAISVIGVSVLWLGIGILITINIICQI